MNIKRILLIFIVLLSIILIVLTFSLINDKVGFKVGYLFDGKIWVKTSPAQCEMIPTPNFDGKETPFIFSFFSFEDLFNKERIIITEELALKLKKGIITLDDLKKIHDEKLEKEEKEENVMIYDYKVEKKEGGGCHACGCPGSRTYYLLVTNEDAKKLRRFGYKRVFISY